MSKECDIFMSADGEKIIFVLRTSAMSTERALEKSGLKSEDVSLLARRDNGCIPMVQIINAIGK